MNVVTTASLHRVDSLYRLPSTTESTPNMNVSTTTRPHPARSAVPDPFPAAPAEAPAPVRWIFGDEPRRARLTLPSGAVVEPSSNPEYLRVNGAEVRKDEALRIAGHLRLLAGS